jgi:hypothetical protein
MQLSKLEDEKALKVGSGRSMSVKMVTRILCLVFLGLALPGSFGWFARGQTAPVGGGLDCNGWSPVSHNLKALPCTDLRGANGGRFYDNGWYIGHDEPSVQFFSRRPHSGNNMVYRITLPKRDPVPTQSGSSVATFELTPAIWFSLAMCDSNSYPQNPCIPDSDSNTGTGLSTDAGSAVLELQLYPPGWPPFINKISCDEKHWCAALNIDSLECNYNQVFCNANCIEPINFAWLQKDGIPTGPPSPGAQTAASLTPNGQTLLMNPGDELLILMKDTPDGLLNLIYDLTTGEVGYMVASAEKGFANTDLNTCANTPYNFHPEYSTARPENINPWGALELNVNIAVETGHFEFQDGDADDSDCYSGPTTAGCLDFASGGDLDFDGPPYLPDWPDGSKHYPSPILIGAFNGRGFGPMSFTDDERGYSAGYPALQFETDIAASEVLTCNFVTGAGCVAPPVGAKFYPFYNQLGSEREHDCLLTFGNDIHGRTTNDFGQDAQYGSPTARFAGNLASGPMRNPCTP